MKLTPLHDRMVVDLIENDQVTASGLIIPDAAAEKPSQADVIAVGPGKYNEDGVLVPSVIRPGDRVLFSKNAVQEFKIDNEKFYIMREGDVMAVVRSPKEIAN